MDTDMIEQIRTGTCEHCGGGIFNRRTDARFCSSGCRVAAYRRSKPPSARENHRLRAEVRRLDVEVQELRLNKERLQSLVQKLRTKESVTLELLSLRVENHALKANVALLHSRLKGMNAARNGGPNKSISALNSGFMSREMFQKIRSCLHTDRSASDERLTEAFIFFSELEPALCKPEPR